MSASPFGEIARELRLKLQYLIRHDEAPGIGQYDYLDEVECVPLIDAACLRAVEQFAEELKARIGSAVTVSGQAVPVLGPAEIDAALRRLRGSMPDVKEQQ